MANKRKRGNPAWAPGMASPNPHGRAVAKAKRAPGSDGVIAYGGYVNEGETNPRLMGSRKWVEYANAYNHPVVAVAALLRSALLVGAKWTLTPNESGGADADRGLEIVDQGLLKARMPKPWPLVVRKAAMHYFHGFSLHAGALGRRPDGMVVYTDLAHRPPHTIERWLRASPDAPFDAVEQRTPDGRAFEIPLGECLYLTNDFGDSPTGTGVLRFVIERLRRTDNYETLEGSELFSSMGGTPIARAPLAEINASAQGNESEVAAYKRARTQNIENSVANRIKTPEKQQWLMLDSATYQGSDPNTISSIKKWDIELLKAEMQGLAEIRGVIRDLHLDVARVLGIEFVMVGGGDSAGTYGMHESKVGLFAASLQTSLTEIAICAEQQLARRLIRANGLDPDTATPHLVPEKITAKAVLEIAQTLAQMQMAALHPSDPARNIIRERLELPPEPEEALADLMLPRVSVGKPGEGDLEDDEERDDVDEPDDEETNE